MSDGAHTHHDHGGTGVILAVIIGLVLAASSGAIAETLTALARLLVIVVAVLAGLALTAGIIAVIVARRREDRQRAWLTGPVHPGAARTATSSPVPSGELAELRAEVTTLRRQLEQHPAALPAGGGYHQHLHFHGADPAVIDAIRQAGSDAR